VLNDFLFIWNRKAIKPIIGHLKSDHRMNRCHLKGAQGVALHAVLCEAGHNIRWLLRMIRKKGLSFYLSLIRMLGLGGLSGLISKFFQPNHFERVNRHQRIGLLA
jgi:IS5 family transposase